MVDILDKRSGQYYKATNEFKLFWNGEVTKLKQIEEETGLIISGVIYQETGEIDLLFKTKKEET